MGAKISTTLKKQNRHILEEFYRYRQSKDSRSDLATNNLLTLLIYFDKFLNGRSFVEVNKTEQILEFLDYKFVTKDGDGKWVKREHDAEGKWIATWNQYGIWFKTFFRWLTNKDKDEDERNRETPSFLIRIKSKKPLRDSPYEESEIWDRDEVLEIIKYVDHLRDKAIIALMWDLDAHNHEITKLRVGSIRLEEQYGQGMIPSNTKTGSGPILLRCSFPYVRDLLNIHPFKNEPNASLIGSLRNGAPIRPAAIRQVMERLRLRVKRMVECGAITNNEEKTKLEYLLRTKKWNPYCLRHSAITDDSDYLPEYALKKKVRWVMNSRQGNRYIKRKMGDELMNEILAHDGIKPIKTRPSSSNHICGRCNYVNKLGKLFDLVKKSEEEEMKKLIAASTRPLEDQIAELTGRVEYDVGYIKEQIKTRHESRKRLTDWLDRQHPNWKQEYYGPDLPFILSVEELEEQLEDRDNDDELDEEELQRTSVASYTYSFKDTRRKST